MRTYFGTLLILFIIVLPVHAQDSLRAKRKSVLSLAYLLPNPGRIMLKQDMENPIEKLGKAGVTYTNEINYTVRGVGPLFFRAEHLLTKNYGLGPVFGFSYAYITHQYLHASNNNGYVLKPTSGAEMRYGLQCYTFGLRNTFYFIKKEKIESYFSLAAGYSYTIEEISDNYPNSYFIKTPVVRNPWFSGGPDFLMDVYHPFYWAATVGFREYLSRSAGYFVELGIDKWSFLQLGLFIRSR